MPDQTAVPSSFRAFVVERRGDDVERGLRNLSLADLPPGEMVVRVEWSSVNYKDALASTANGKVARISPLVPGIDLAGTVVSSEDPRYVPGERVIVHGYEQGVSRHGGYSEYARVSANEVVPLPLALTTREAMTIGTAGFTAAMSVAALQERGLTPDDGPVLVTGASGGVGCMAISMLNQNRIQVVAVTGKTDETDRLKALGASEVLDRSVYALGAGKTFESERWAGAIDSVGSASLPYVLRTLKYGAAVAATGNTSGGGLETTVFPFILRGVTLIGIDSAHLPIGRRRILWERLAHDLRPVGMDPFITEIGLDDLPSALDAILAERARGRWIVRVAE
jgi:putative YhdH/YhfP family quinone oxidoreductase